MKHAFRMLHVLVLDQKENTSSCRIFRTYDAEVFFCVLTFLIILTVCQLLFLTVGYVVLRESVMP